MPRTTGQQKDTQMGWVTQGSRHDIANILMEFAQELRNGDVNVWNLKRELHLNPEGQLVLHVQAHVDENGREGLQMKLQWNASGEAMDISDFLKSNAIGGVNA